MSNILLIEDQDDNRAMLKLLLQQLNYRVIAAATADEALSQAAKNPIDIILTDVGLPDMNGVELVRRLRNGDGRLRDTPVIILSAFDEAEYGAEARRAGCSVFFKKPVDFETLAERIAALLKARGAKRSNR
jgi:DNA-binding response OmpR family regulator